MSLAQRWPGEEGGVGGHGALVENHRCCHQPSGGQLEVLVLSALST